MHDYVYACGCVKVSGQFVARCRRWVVLEANDVHARNNTYWTPIAELVQHPDTASLFYRFLVTRDLGGYNPRDIPDNRSRLDIKLATRDLHAAFLQDVICNQDMYHWIKDGEMAVPKRDMFKDFQEWCDKQPAHLKAGTLSQFVKALKRYDLRPVNFYYKAQGFERGSTVIGYNHVNLDDLKNTLIAKDAWDEDAE